METTKKEFKVYKYEELSDNMKEKAFQKWFDSQSQDYFWGESNKASLEAFEKIFPIKVKDWEYGYINYINFELLTDYNEGDFTGKRLLAYIFNNFYLQITKGKYYSKYPKFRRSKIFRDYSCALTGYYIDDFLIDPIKNLEQTIIKRPNYSFEDLMSDCLNNWIHACNKDYEYYISEEYFKEEIENNEWEFLENGSIYFE